MSWPNLVPATSPTAARKAADRGKHPAVDEDEVKDDIIQIAANLYQHEWNTPFWHRNHYGKPEKPCILPDLDVDDRVHLGYFECLYYLVVMKVKELYDELRMRLQWGNIYTPGYILHRYGISSDNRSPCTIENFLVHLTDYWKTLNSFGLVSTIDSAIRLRNLGDPTLQPIKDSTGRSLISVNERRNELLKKENDNVRFMFTQGLLDLNSMNTAMLVASIKSLHKESMKAKRRLPIKISSTRKHIEHERARTLAALEGRRFFRSRVPPPPPHRPVRNPVRWLQDVPEAPAPRRRGRDQYGDLALYREGGSPGRYNTAVMQEVGAGPRLQAPPPAAPTTPAPPSREAPSPPSRPAPVPAQVTERPRPLVRRFSDWSLDSKEERVLFVEPGPGPRFEDRPQYAAPLRLPSRDGTFSMSRKDLMSSLPAPLPLPKPAATETETQHERKRSGSGSGGSGKIKSWFSSFGRKSSELARKLSKDRTEERDEE